MRVTIGSESNLVCTEIDFKMLIARALLNVCKKLVVLRLYVLRFRVGAGEFYGRSEPRYADRCEETDDCRRPTLPTHDR